MGKLQSTVRSIIKVIRPQQWVKNLLLFLPLALAHKANEIDLLVVNLYAFIAFCSCASAGYVVNDMLDAHADRHHVRKASRPFASGQLTNPVGVLLALFLGGTGLLTAFLAVNYAYAWLVVLYMVVTLLYSASLKKVAVVDVLILAGLFTLRILAGGEAVQLEVSQWLMGFSMFFFFSLAMLKRYAELVMLHDNEQSDVRGRGYCVDDLPIIRNIGSTSGFLSVLVLALYIYNSEVASTLYAQKQVLWLTCPLLMYWITRAWLYAHRRRMTDDPVAFAVKDVTTYFVLLLILLLAIYASVKQGL